MGREGWEGGAEGWKEAANVGRAAGRYVEALERAGVSVVKVEAEESCPDCVFVEDTLLAVDADNVILCPVGSPSRKAELPGMEAAARALGYTVLTLAAEPKAVMDGGDVLRLGNHWFVGLTRRTNAAATAALATVLSRRGDEVIGIPFRHEKILHLKSVCSPLGTNAVVVVSGPVGDSVVDAISRKRPQTTFVRVPDAPAANVLSVNETVLVRSSSEFPRSVPILQRACQIAGLASVEVEGSELAKIDGALTCGSVLLF